MRKIASVFFVSAFLLTSVSFAQETSKPDFKETNITIIPEDQVIEGDFFAVGELVEVNGTVNGDLYAAGEKVSVDGTVNGDVLAAGGKVHISGNVLQDVRVAGGEVVVSGTVGRNITVFAGTFNTLSSSEIQGNITAWTGQATIDGPVQGNLVLTAGQESMGPQGTINGDVTRTPFPIHKKEIQDSSKDFALFLKIISFLSILITGLLFIHLFPAFNKNAFHVLQKKPLKSFVLGVILCISIPFVVISLLITLVGIPIGLILGALYMMLLYISSIPPLYYVGQKILEKLEKDPHDAWVFVTGLISITILSFIPVISAITSCLVLLLGVGSLTIALKQTYEALVKKKML